MRRHERSRRAEIGVHDGRNAQARGDDAAMRAAVADYLAAHPNGFRAKDVQKLAC